MPASFLPDMPHTGNIQLGIYKIRKTYEEKETGKKREGNNSISMALR